jgi:tetratricopeptide (TPR) repeat protein
MRRIFTAVATVAGVVSLLAAGCALAATGTEPTEAQVDPGPCVAAAAANNDDQTIVICGPLIENEKTSKADRIKALIARAAVYVRKDQTDRAIGDYDTVLRLDPTLADVFNSRGELWRKKGNRPRALSDFGTAVKLNPNHAAAMASYKSLSLEVERIGALMAVAGKPSFNCARAKRPVEKAICANPELADLDREINSVNTGVVREAAIASPGAGRAMQREQDEFITRRNASFGRPEYDLLKAMRERLDHLLAVKKPEEGLPANLQKSDRH